MKYKSLILLILVLILSIAAVSARDIVLSKSNELRIDLLRYDPSPIQPGEESSIWFEVTNLGQSDLTNFVIEIADGSGNILSNKFEPLNFGKLAAGEKITFRLPLVVNQGLPDGDYALSIQYYSKRLGSITSQPFTIKVKRVNRDISAIKTEISSSNLQIGMLNQGMPSEFKVTLDNTANYIMKDISVKLDLTSAAIPIAPIGTTSEAKIRSMAPGESREAIFNLIALPDATSNIYKVPIIISYYDEMGNNFSTTNLVGLLIDGEPELHLELKSNQVYKKLGTGEVTINIVNKGLAKVKFLTAKLDYPNENYKIFGINLLGKGAYHLLSEDSVYLGDIDPDDDESVDFIIQTRSLTGELMLPLVLQFRDANNEIHEESFEIIVPIHSKTKLGLESNSYLSKILFLIVLALFFFNYRKWGRQTRNKGLMNYLSHLKSKIFKKNA